MAILNSLRPGVYSSYDVTSSYASARSGKYAAVVAKANGGTAGTVYGLSSYAEALEVFLPDSDSMYMRGILKILFDAGVSGVICAPCGGNYAEALALIEETENIGAVICDCRSSAGLLALKASLEKSSEGFRERLGFAGIDSAQDALLDAQLLNSERISICCPAVGGDSGARSAVFAAAALAAKILVSGDPAVNLNGERFPQLALPDALAESDIQLLLAVGVTVFESCGSVCECVRAQTTRVKTNGASDRTFAGINTIMIIDDVLAGLRNALKTRLRGGRAGGITAGSIQSQAMVELAARQSEGLLESFSPPRCYPSAEDPEVCVVELAFRVAHVVSQIAITAHIRV